MKDRTREDFGDVIRGIRLLNRISQREVAVKMHVSQAHISLLESGRAKPYLFEIVEYSYHIGSGPSALMKEAARIWGKNHGEVINKDVNPELILHRTHTYPAQYVPCPYAQDWGHCHSGRE